MDSRGVRVIEWVLTVIVLNGGQATLERYTHTEQIECMQTRERFRRQEKAGTVLYVGECKQRGS